MEGTVSLRNLFVLWFPSAVGIILGAALQVSLGTHQGGKGGIAFLLSCYPLNPEGGTEQPSLSAAAAWVGAPCLPRLSKSVEFEPHAIGTKESWSSRYWVLFLRTHCE